jgi:excisionase family DNA binding protein
MLPGLLTRAEVAVLLRIGERTVDRWTIEGRLRRVEIAPRTIRYRAEDIEAMTQPRNDDDPPGKRAAVTTGDDHGVRDTV